MEAIKNQTRKRRRGFTESGRETRAHEIWRRFRKNKTAMLGLVLLTLILIPIMFANLISPEEMITAQSAKDRLLPPSAAHLFGTDSFGRDVFTRIIYGGRTSLLIGVGTTLMALIIGGALGAVAAYYGGRVDSIIMRIMDAFTCIPPILLALAIVASLGPSMLNLFIAITIACVPNFTRMIRSVVMSIAEQDFIEAATAFGSSDFRIILRHIVPNAVGPIIVQATMNIAGMILAAATISFIGMGVQPPAPEWGSMLSESRVLFRRAPYLLWFPGCAILLSALSFNLIGDGLRDALDPKLRN